MFEIPIRGVGSTLAFLSQSPSFRPSVRLHTHVKCCDCVCVQLRGKNSRGHSVSAGQWPATVTDKDFKGAEIFRHGKFCVLFTVAVVVSLCNSDLWPSQPHPAQLVCHCPTLTTSHFEKKQKNIAVSADYLHCAERKGAENVVYSKVWPES